MIDAYSAYLTPFTTKGSEYQPPESGGLLLAITESARLAKANTIQALTAATGGRRLGFETKSKLENDFIALGTDIHSRYMLSFAPEGERAPAFHQLEIQIRDHPDAKVHARPGYWSTSAGTE